MRTTVTMDVEIEHEGDAPPTLALSDAIRGWMEGENVYVQDDPRTFTVIGGSLSKHDPSHPDNAAEAGAREEPDDEPASEPAEATTE